MKSTALLLMIVPLVLCTKVIEYDHAGKAYIYEPTKMNYTAAVAYCKSRNASLVMIRSQQETDWIRANVKPNDEFHMGIASMTNGNAKLIYLDNTSVFWTNFEGECGSLE